MAADEPPPTVAVVGLGALGLVTLKNLVEQGLDATGFDKAPVVGGLWNFSNDGGLTTVLETTVSNISKQRGCFTDYPFPRDTPTFPQARHVQQYLCDYARHFSLGPRMRLSTEVLAVAREQESAKWRLEMQSGDDKRTECFDKLVFATGINKLPHMPAVDGLATFDGLVMHSRGYKGPAAFKDKLVLIVGFSNSAADIATDLVGHAKHVYVSRRHDNFVMSRFVDGKPFDQGFTHRKSAVFHALLSWVPSLADKMMRSFLTETHKKGCPSGVPPDMDLATAPLLTRVPPIVSDSLVSEMLAGNITLVRGLRSVSGPRTAMLDDGRALDVDAIVFCTGYQTDYSLAGAFDPTLEQPEAWTSAVGSNARALPRLYRNIFSLALPQSLAFMGSLAFPSPAFQLYDVASMALAQVWAGRFSLPPARDMAAHVDAQHAWLAALAAHGTVIPGWVHGFGWSAWADEAAGTAVAAHLGYGLAGWAFWLRDRALAAVLMDGVPSPHLYRLFETGRRRAWRGARDEIMRINSGAVDK